MVENQFAPVANLPIYKHLERAGELGSYHLLIATEVAKDLDGWAQFWKGPAHRYTPFTIMDNGLIEAGAAADHGLVKAACEATNATCVVLPDVLGDYTATTNAAVEAYDDFRKIGLPLMGVIQGKTLEEVAAITQLYIDMDVDYLSIPRVMVEHFGTRRWIVERARWFGKPIHLLGWSEDVEDDLMCAGMGGVMGIDSAVPIWRGLVPIAETMPHVPPRHGDFGKRPKDYWEKDADPNRVDMDLVISNIRWVRSWIARYAQTARSAGKG